MGYGLVRMDSGADEQRRSRELLQQIQMPVQHRSLQSRTNLLARGPAHLPAPTYLECAQDNEDGSREDDSSQ